MAQLASSTLQESLLNHKVSIEEQQLGKMRSRPPSSVAARTPQQRASRASFAEALRLLPERGPATEYRSFAEDDDLFAERISDRLRQKCAMRQQRRGVLELQITGEKVYHKFTLRELQEHMMSLLEPHYTPTTQETPNSTGSGSSAGDSGSVGRVELRDLRRLELHLNSSASDSFKDVFLSVRRHCILFSVEPFTGAILSDRLIVLQVKPDLPLLSALHEHLFIEEVNTEDVASHCEWHTDLVHASVQDKGKDHRAPRHSHSDSETQPLRLKDLLESRPSYPSVVSDEDIREFLRLPVPPLGRANSIVRKLGPFELRALDTIFAVALGAQESNVEELEGDCSRLLWKMSSTEGASTENYERLREFKKNLKKHKANLQRYLNIISEKLEDDEAMALMNLTSFHRRPENYTAPLSETVINLHTQPEIILEAYMQDFTILIAKVEMLQGEIGHKEEEMILRMDTARNQLLTIGTIFSMISTCLTCGALVTGIFGQNLRNGAENSHRAFLIATITTVGSVFVIAVVTFMFLKKRGILVA